MNKKLYSLGAAALFTFAASFSIQAQSLKLPPQRASFSGAQFYGFATSKIDDVTAKVPIYSISASESSTPVAVGAEEQYGATGAFYNGVYYTMSINFLGNTGIHYMSQEAYDVDTWEVHKPYIPALEMNDQFPVHDMTYNPADGKVYAILRTENEDLYKLCTYDFESKVRK